MVLAMEWPVHRPHAVNLSKLPLTAAIGVGRQSSSTASTLGYRQTALVSGRFRMKPHAQRMSNFEHSCKARISGFTQCLVEALAA